MRWSFSCSERPAYGKTCCRTRPEPYTYVPYEPRLAGGAPSPRRNELVSAMQRDQPGSLVAVDQRPAVSAIRLSRRRAQLQPGAVEDPLHGVHRRVEAARLDTAHQLLAAPGGCRQLTPTATKRLSGREQQHPRQARAVADPPDAVPGFIPPASLPPRMSLSRRAARSHTSRHLNGNAEAPCRWRNLVSC